MTTGLSTPEAPTVPPLDKVRALGTIRKVREIALKQAESQAKAGGKTLNPSEVKFGLSEMRNVEPVKITKPDEQTEQSFDILQKDGLLDKAGGTENTDVSYDALSNARQFAIEEAGRGVAELTKPKDQGGEFGLTQEQLSKMSLDELLKRVPDHWKKDPTDPEGAHTIDYLRNALEFAQEKLKEPEEVNPDEIPDEVMTPEFARDLLESLAHGSRGLHKMLNTKAVSILAEQDRIVKEGGTADPSQMAFAYDLQIAVLDDQIERLKLHYNPKAEAYGVPEAIKLGNRIRELLKQQEPIRENRNKLPATPANNIELLARKILNIDAKTPISPLTALRERFEKGIHDPEVREELSEQVASVGKDFGLDVEGVQGLSSMMKNERTREIAEKSAAKTAQVAGLLTVLLMFLAYKSANGRPQGQ